MAIAHTTVAGQQFTPQYVNLGLPSGTLWATSNVGADTPEGLGDYFAWGETKPKTVYEWSSYAFMNNDKMDGKDGMKKDADWFNVNKYIFNDQLKGGIWYSGTTFVGDNKKTLEAADDAATANWGGNWAMPTADTHIFLPAAGYRNASVDIQKASESHYWSSSLSEYLI